MLVTLKDYAKTNGRSPISCRQMAVRGGFQTAQKMGRGWVIDDAEVYPDARKKGNDQLKAKDVFTSEAYKALTAEERRDILKWEQAKQYSGWRNHPSTCAAIFELMPEDMLNRYTAAQLGEIASLLKVAYDNGKNDR